MLLFRFTALGWMQESIKELILAVVVKAFDCFKSLSATLKYLVAINGSIRL